MEVNMDGLKLLILSTDCYSDEFTAELFRYYNAESQVIFDNKIELQVLATNVKRLSVLTLSMIEALEVSDNSDEIIDDIYDTAVINLDFSEELLRILALAKR
jgi:hypothetical protein